MKRSKFSLSHYKLFTCNMGALIPCGLVEVLPGDTFQHATSALLRCSPLVTPVMHPVHVKIHHWYVPFRILWDEWEDFITGGEDGMATPEFPHVTLSGADRVTTGSLFDYLGIDPRSGDGYDWSVSALPFRAYNLIFNEWYRDQDLIGASQISKDSGDDSTTDTDLRNVAWEKDYYTTARPWDAKGPAITLPLGTSAPLSIHFQEGGTTAQTVNLQRNNASAGALLQILEAGTLNDPITAQGTADLSTASAVSINVLREALALQRFEEARARYGSRYTEYLRYLGVKSSDARLQRPEYLGGGKQTIQFSEVLSTNFTASTLNPGQFGGHGIAAMRSNRYRRFFEEHGYVMTLLSVLPRTMYANGIPRHMFSTQTKERFWQRELQHIGQQEVQEQEVFLDSFDASPAPDSRFGFQDRYDEYRRQESGIAGQMRTIYKDWHFARNFSSGPTLNGDFVQADPTKQPFADQTNDTLIVMSNHSIQARRLVAPRGNSLTF